MNQQGIAGVMVAGFAIVLSDEQVALLAMFLASVGGTYASFVWADPVEPRPRMAHVFVACVIMGMSFTFLVNSIVGWKYPELQLNVGARAGTSAIVSCLTRFIMPKLIEAIKDGSWKSLIPFLGRKQ